jgi:hypothetical protein
MVVRIHTKDGIKELNTGMRVAAGAWRETASSKDGVESVRKLKEALDRAESRLKHMRPKRPTF